jgi:hypothetical protein
MDSCSPDGTTTSITGVATNDVQFLINSARRSGACCSSNVVVVLQFLTPLVPSTSRTKGRTTLLLIARTAPNANRLKAPAFSPAAVAKATISVDSRDCEQAGSAVQNSKPVGRGMLKSSRHSPNAVRRGGESGRRRGLANVGFRIWKVLSGEGVGWRRRRRHSENACCFFGRGREAGCII